MEEEVEDDERPADDDGAHDHGAAHACRGREEVETAKPLFLLGGRPEDVDRPVLVTVPIHRAPVQQESP